MNKALLFLVIFFALERFCHSQTEGFSLSKMITHPLSTAQKSEMTLTLIGAGKQFYAFETPDHAHVVKFMKFSRRRPLPWLEKLPLPSLLQPFKQNYLAARAKRLSHLQKSSTLASHTLSEETGIVSPDFLPQFVTLIDKLGIAHQIDLNQTCFYVQKKATLFPTYFENHPTEANSLISSYIATIAAQCSKGVCNLDPVVDRNYGVVDKKLIVLDFGSLLSHDKLHKQREIFLELLPLREWLQQNHPEHLSFFDSQLKKTISQITIKEQQVVR